MHEDYFEDIEFLLKRIHYSGIIDENCHSTYANDKRQIKFIIIMFYLLTF